MRGGRQLVPPPPCLVTAGSHHCGSLRNHKARVLRGREPSICQAEQGSPPQPVTLGPGAGHTQERPQVAGSRAKQGGCWAGLGVAGQEAPELASGTTWRQNSPEESFERGIK